MIREAFEYMAEHPVPGCFCEFGVWQGDGLLAIQTFADRMIYGTCPSCKRDCRVRSGAVLFCNGCGHTSVPDPENPSVYGFDSFEGMPVTAVPLKDNHAEVWRPGGYADTSVDLVQRKVPSATIIKGVFSELRTLADYGIDKVRFARIDCDIYEGYRDALRLLTPCIQKGTVLLFDEGMAPDDPRYHDSVRDSGQRAIMEWQYEAATMRFLVINGTEVLAVVE